MSWRDALAPRLARGVTRVHGTMRPYLNVVGPGGGAIADLAVDHYFIAPFKLRLAMAPAAVAVDARAPGLITHLRIGAAYATDYLELGAELGGRIQGFGASGLSLAGAVRLGALDGLHLELTLGYAAGRNFYTGNPRLALSNAIADLEIPLGARVRLVVEGGFSFDLWIYTTLGLKHYLVGRGGPGTWILHAGFGAAWVLDRCPYEDPRPCEGSAWGLGPTIAFGLDRRF